jgi:NADH:ubiquinone oxidoreductase subunit 2 (subunit N)
LFSIAGIPPLAGFFVKFNVMLALFDESFGFTLCWLVLLSCLAGFYYLRRTSQHRVKPNDSSKRASITLNLTKNPARGGIPAIENKTKANKAQNNE